MSDCPECGCPEIPDGRGFAVCIPCLCRENNKLKRHVKELREEIYKDYCHTFDRPDAYNCQRTKEEYYKEREWED